MSEITGILLAGGASTRMGQDKAMLPWGKTTLLDHIATSLQPRLHPLFVVGQPFQDLPALAVAAETIYDRQAHQGPLAGLLTGLEIAPKHQPVFLTGCDFPFLVPQVVDCLAQHLGNYDAAVIEHHGQLQTLIGIYQPGIQSQVVELLSKGQRSMLALLSKLSFNVVATENWMQHPLTAMTFSNINTPEEYQTAHAHYLEAFADSESL